MARGVDAERECRDAWLDAACWHYIANRAPAPGKGGDAVSAIGAFLFGAAVFGLGAFVTSHPTAHEPDPVASWIYGALCALAIIAAITMLWRESYRVGDAYDFLRDLQARR